MTNGSTLFDDFTASVVEISSGGDGVSTVRLSGDLPYWHENGIEVVEDGQVIATTDQQPDLEKVWALDVSNVPAGEHN